ncbi:hypothetical protein [Corynebacterium sp.]|nr:hypothetical protein [Corynebacterium sp.]MDY5785579.1 hypothetical protein [Corynebacterium sp.]
MSDSSSFVEAFVHLSSISFTEDFFVTMSPLIKIAEGASKLLGMFA